MSTAPVLTMTKPSKPPMASASSKTGGLALFVPIIGPVTVAAAGYAAWKIHWAVLLKEFFTGPGRVSRILMLLFAIFNWKNMPFAWTVRTPEAPSLEPPKRAHTTCLPKASKLAFLIQ